MRRLARPAATVAVLAVVGATALAACGKSSPGNSSSVGGVSAGGLSGTSLPAASTKPQKTGTITVVQPPNSAPTWILPLITAADNSVYTVPLFDYEMFRPLLWTENGTSPAYNAQFSLASYPTASNGDKTFTIKLKGNYKWSDGQPVTAQDVVFWYDLMKAAIKQSPANWAGYTPKIGMPDQVASVTATNATTVVFQMKSPINASELLLNEVGSIQPLPIQSMAKTSAGGAAVSDWSNPAVASKIYTFLSKASMSESTWATNPVWATVDGPYKLASINSTSGAFTLNPNTAYSGPTAHKISPVSSVPFTSDTAEYNAVRSGNLDVGYVPLANLPQIASIKSAGYSDFAYPDFGWLYVAYNFKDKTNNFDKVIGQLYIRQALAHLQDQQGLIHAFFNGAASQAYGPVPPLPKSPFTPSNAVNNPYPFSVATAAKMLTDHGWKVNAGGISTCAKAGSAADECGAGIPAGQKLSFPLAYTTNPANIGEEVTALASEAKKVGFDITLKSSNFTYLIQNYNNPAAPTNESKWAMMDFGGFTNSTYPTTFGVFNCTGSSNLGSYCDPQADKLINDSLFSTNPHAVSNEASYLTTNQPGLFQPNPASALESGSVLVVKKSLSGPPATFESITQYYYNPEMWYFVK